ncbi:MAG: TIGR03667 family PPOX class F420-dependent oxidoreductase [Actinomycetota bacterium]
MAFLDPRKRTHVHAGKRLGTELIVWLTTVAPEGRPQSTPVWFLWDGDVFHMYSQPDKPKLRNIRANPRASLHLEGGEEGSDVVTFEGRAEIATNTAPATSNPEYIKKYRRLIEGFGWTPESFAHDYSVALRITPSRARIWRD